jgi:hypothetical protein
MITLPSPRTPAPTWRVAHGTAIALLGRQLDRELGDIVASTAAVHIGADQLLLLGCCGRRRATREGAVPMQMRHYARQGRAVLCKPGAAGSTEIAAERLADALGSNAGVLSGEMQRRSSCTFALSGSQG